MTTDPAFMHTDRPLRTVLAVVRNGAAAARMFEILALLDNDRRINVRVTVGPDSDYRHGVSDLLREHQVRPMPWREAVESRFDLTLSGSASRTLRHLRSPVIVFPHGAGHHKLRHGGPAAIDLEPEQVMHLGKPIPTAFLLPGERSRRLLLQTCPQAEDSAIIAGDPVAQQLRQNLRFRPAFRHKLGLGAKKRLVVVTSTWGSNSLAATRLGLLERLICELPTDQYQVAAIFHRNVTVHDGQYQLNRKLRAARDAGLVMIPMATSWQPYVIAADCVLGDHGSTTFYAADVAPVAIVAQSPDEHPPDGPVPALMKALPHLDLHEALHPQIDRLTSEPRRADVAAILASSIDGDADAAAVFRSTMYRLMRLDEPRWKPSLPLRLTPLKPPTAPTAFRVHTHLPADSERPVVRLTRYPAMTADPASPTHLVVRTDDTDGPRWQHADVTVAVCGEPELSAVLGLGARVAVQAITTDSCLLHDVDGTSVIAHIDTDANDHSAALVASAYYHFAESTRPLPETITVDNGVASFCVRFERRSTR